MLTWTKALFLSGVFVKPASSFSIQYSNATGVGLQCQEKDWGCHPNWKNECCPGLKCDTSEGEGVGGKGHGTCVSEDKCQEEGWGCHPTWKSECCRGLKCVVAHGAGIGGKGHGTCSGGGGGGGNKGGGRPKKRGGGRPKKKTAKKGRLGEGSRCKRKNVLTFKDVELATSNSLMTFKDVLPPINGHPVDLELLNEQGYQAFDAARNGLDDRFGALNFKTDTSATIRFRFVDRNTGKKVTPEPFYFTIFDLDEEKTGGFGRESVQVRGALNYFRAKQTSVESEDGETFHSTEYGSYQDNPGTGNERDRNPRDLDAVDRRQAISFAMPAVSTFLVEFSVAAASRGVEGRNIEFGGASSLTCK